MFFRLFDLLKHQKANIGIAPKPFAGALELNGNLFVCLLYSWGYERFRNVVKMETI